MSHDAPRTPPAAAAPSGDGEKGSRGPRVAWAGRVTRPSWRNVGRLLAPMLVLLTMVVMYTPLPSNLAGATHCLPVIGPFVQIDGSLSERERTLTLAHEEAHELQCWDQGFVSSLTALLSHDRRLDAELQAFCAEGRAELMVLGNRPDVVLARILDELQEGYRWMRTTSRYEFVWRLRRSCPEVVARRQQPVG